MAKVVTFGDIMLRLSPPGNQRIVQSRSFDALYGGGEANVAYSLSQFNIPVKFVTKLPKNMIGQAAMNSLAAFGVDISDIILGGERCGIYFYEKGAAVRASKVIYDRKNTAISKVKAAEFDWDKIFTGAEWFHFTGITPALGDNVAQVCMEACQCAKKLNMTVSCDLNFRKNLWTSQKANQVMTTLMPYVDIAIGNEEDAEKVFGIKASSTDITKGMLNTDGYKDVAKELVKRFGFNKVAITLRESLSASENGWSGMLYDGKDFFNARRYQIQIVDRVGSGDSFSAGLIYSLLNGYDGQTAIEFAVAASALKHTIEGDYNIISEEEVMSVADGDVSGRVQR